MRTVPLTQCSLNELFLHPAFREVLGQAVSHHKLACLGQGKS